MSERKGLFGFIQFRTLARTLTRERGLGDAAVAA